MKNITELPSPLIRQRVIDEDIFTRCIEEGFSETLSRVIAGREINKNTASIKQSLMPTLHDIEKPDSLIDIDKAVDRLLIAKNNDEIINLCTDFDTDGQTSLSVLFRGLLLLGFKKELLTYMSAHRLVEGYGLTDAMVERILDQKPRCSLIVTADNGSSNADSIAKLSEEGIDVIVTDHHALIDGPPDKAVAVVNPVRSDCLFPDKSIAGVSVAFMLLLSLRERLIQLGEVDSSISIAPLLSFCGLGTQADCVHLGKSLTNRAMVRYALSYIHNNDSFVCWDALKRLGKNGDSVIDSDFLSFTIAPAINAAGRLGTAKPAGDLFLTDDRDHAFELVSQLAEFNENRKKIERAMTKDAKVIALEKHNKGNYGLSCYLSDGNPGVVGIVGSRIMQIFGKPSLIISPMVNDPGVLTGSLRSTDAYSVKDGIAWINEHYPELLIRGGGHDRAGGLSIYSKNLEQLYLAYEQSCREQIENPSVLLPIIETDGFIEPDAISLDLYYKISSLQPFGQGFPSPVFEIVGVLDSIRMVGNPAVHAQVNIKIADNIFKGIWFFCKDDQEDDFPLVVNEEYHWIFNLSENVFRGASTVQLIIKACEKLSD